MSSLFLWKHCPWSDSVSQFMDVATGGGKFLSPGRAAVFLLITHVTSSDHGLWCMKYTFSRSNLFPKLYF